MSRPPPTRPSSAIIHNVGEAVATLTSETALVCSSNQSTTGGGSDDSSPKPNPNPTFTATIPEKKDGNENVHSQMDDVDLPFPPAPGKIFQLKSSQPFSASDSNTNSEHDDEADAELMRDDGGVDLTLTEKVFELRSRSRTESKASDSEIRLKVEENDRANLTSSVCNLTIFAQAYVTPINSYTNLKILSYIRVRLGFHSYFQMYDRILSCLYVCVCSRRLGIKVSAQLFLPPVLHIYK